MELIRIALFPFIRNCYKWKTLREEAHDAQEEYVAEATARQRESFASETLCFNGYAVEWRGESGK